MQGVVKAYDPTSGLGIVMCDTDLDDYDLAADALEGSLFRMLRQGQRVVFDLDDAGQATHLRLGSEIDMGTPARTDTGADTRRSSAGHEPPSDHVVQTLSALVERQTICFSDGHICTNSRVPDPLGGVPVTAVFARLSGGS